MKKEDRLLGWLDGGGKGYPTAFGTIHNEDQPAVVVWPAKITNTFWKSILSIDFFIVTSKKFFTI